MQYSVFPWYDRSHKLTGICRSFASQNFLSMSERGGSVFFWFSEFQASNSVHVIFGSECNVMHLVDQHALFLLTKGGIYLK